MRAVAYIRVSDASQVEGHSLNAQERLFQELCKSRGWEPIKVYREEGVSAHSDAIAKRPQYKQLLDDAAKDLFDAVVVHTLDRWARNLRVQLEGMAILSRHGIGFVSITENIDYSTAQGRLQAQILGSFAEYFSESLAGHIRKGQDQRAQEGRHTGGIPIGYASCKDEEGRPTCEPEHPGGVHLILAEAEAVRQLFRKYAKGATSTVQLASWMNDQGYRTRNMHRFGAEAAEPRYFTSASVRGILHNPFYGGKIRHREEIHEGVHESLVPWDMFEQVQALMKRNSGRSRTFESRPERDYLLKGIIRCAQCEMPMWSQTYKNGHRYYREHRGSRGIGACVNSGGSVRCETVDEQMRSLIGALVLPTNWLERVLERISLRDEVARVRAEREKMQEKLKRLGKAYVDGLIDESDYQRQKAQYEFELASLVVPEADMVAEAGRLVQNLPELWAQADLRERRRLLLSILDAVYVDPRDPEAILRIRPKRAFAAVLGEAEALVHQH